MSRAVEVEAMSELSELAAAVRAHVEWLVTSGAAGVPRDRSGASPRAAAPNVVETAPNVVETAPDVVETEPDVAETAPDVAETPVIVQPSPAVVVALPGAAAGAPAPLLEVSERRRRLELLAERVKPCTRCALHAGRTQTVFARGTGTSGLCFVGEGPGADEDAQGFPFVGKAGQLLDRMIEAMGFGRDDVYVCNIVKCRPPNNRKPEPEEMAACMPYLKEQLELLQPEVMVALGATAVQGLFGTTEGITRLRGRWKLYGGRTPVMPTFHPAFLLRNPAAKREVWDDLQAVLRQMGRQAPKR